MAILESNVSKNIDSEFVIVPVVCPICNSKKEVNVPKSVMSRTKNLATISIQEDITCKHHFQIFIDKNYAVRGYQKVDFQIGSNFKEPKKLHEHQLKNNKNSVSEKSQFLYDSHESRSLVKGAMPNQVKKEERTKGKMTLKNVYEEFREFIDDDNEEFMEFISKDKKRKTLLKSN